MVIVAQVDSTYTYDTIPIYPSTHLPFLDHWQLLLPLLLLLCASHPAPFGRIGCAWRAVFLSSPCFPFVTQNVCLPKLKYESNERTKPENWKIVRTIAGLESFQFFPLRSLNVFIHLWFILIDRLSFSLRLKNVECWMFFCLSTVSLSPSTSLTPFLRALFIYGLNFGRFPFNKIPHK